MWKAGGVSVWQVKAKTGFSARVLVPLFALIALPVGAALFGPR